LFGVAFLIGFRPQAGAAARVAAVGVALAAVFFRRRTA
jgi:hypothetical protein